VDLVENLVLLLLIKVCMLFYNCTRFNKVYFCRELELVYFTMCLYAVFIFKDFLLEQ